MKTCEPCEKELPGAVSLSVPCDDPAEEPVTPSEVEADPPAEETIPEKTKPEVEISEDPTGVIERFFGKRDLTKKMPQKKTLLVTAGVLALVAALAIGAVLLIYYLSPRQTLLRAWEDRDFNTVTAILAENPDLTGDQEFIDEMRQCVEELTTAYWQEETDYAKTMEGLTTAEKMQLKGLENLLTVAMQNTAAIEISRGCFEEAEALFNAGKQLEARSLYLQVIEKDNHYDTARKRLKDCDEVFRQKVTEDAALQAQKGDYPAAIAVLEEAMYTLPDDEALQQQIDEYEAQYALQLKNELLKQAEDLAADQDFIGAMKLLEDSSDVDILAAYDGYYDQYITHIETSAGERNQTYDFSGAVKTVQQALEFAPEEERLQKALDTCAEAAISRSRELMEERSYDQAHALIKELCGLLPKNKKLKDRLEEVEAETPLFLTDVSAAFQAAEHVEYMEDSFVMRGKEYSNGFTLGDHGYAWYNISAKYQSMTLTVGHVDETAMGNATLLVYGDSKQILNVPLEATAAPQTITVDLTGIRQLKFVIQCSNQVAANHQPFAFRYGLGEVVVEK